MGNPEQETEGVVLSSKKIRLSWKFEAWAKLFMDESNPKYWGNATQCALKVYDTDNYHSAGQIGHENLKKLEKMAFLILEGAGIGFGELMKIGLTKMMKGSYGDWEAFMELLGYFKTVSKNEKAESESTFDFNNLNVTIRNARKARGLKD